MIANEITVGKTKQKAKGLSIQCLSNGVACMPPLAGIDLTHFETVSLYVQGPRLPYCFMYCRSSHSNILFFCWQQQLADSLCPHPPWIWTRTMSRLDDGYTGTFPPAYLCACTYLHASQIEPHYFKEWPAHGSLLPASVTLLAAHQM